jgi:hypothetical protein
MKGIRSARARSAARVIFSPTTEPMLPPMKPKSMAEMMTLIPSSVPMPLTTASGSEVFLCWSVIRRA